MSPNPSAIALHQFTTFGDLLKHLRRRAGLTQRELSIAVGYGSAHISRLELNQRLPDLATVTARFVPALDLADEPETARRLLELAAVVRREDAPTAGLPPYKGLLHFDESDAEMFFGREALTARLAARVMGGPLAGSEQAPAVPGTARFLAVVGASGSGKSSLMRAGLIPALRWAPGSAGWPVYVLTPTAHPLEALAASLLGEAKTQLAKAALEDELAAEACRLHSALQEEAKRLEVVQAVVVVDQFEELYSLCRAEAERRAFVDNLLAAAREPGGPGVVIIALRADFYAHCAGHPDLREALAQHQEYIGAMTAEELRQTIEAPARRGHWELEPGLVEQLLGDVGADGGGAPEPGALPLLSHALLETWQRRRGNTLTLSGYAASGGVRGAIAETAEAVFRDHLSPAQRAIARHIFLRLTELGEDESVPDTRRRVGLPELVTHSADADAVREVLTLLADARLVTTEQDTAEVAHEALIREWPTLREWLAEGREGLRLHRHLTEAAQEWARRGREAGELYRGARLAQAAEWAQSSGRGGDLNALERDFLQASREQSERDAAEREAQRQRELDAAQRVAEAAETLARSERQRAADQARTSVQLRQRARYLAGALSLVVVAALAAGVLAGSNAQLAVSNAAIASTAQANERAAVLFGEQARQAALTAQENERATVSRELSAAAVGSLDIDPERGLLLAMEAVSVTYAVDQTWTTEAEDALRAALQAWRVELTFRTRHPRFGGIAFSPDGTRLLTSSQDGTLSIWDAATGQELLSLETGAVARSPWIMRPVTDFSPDGTRVAGPSAGDTATVWDTSDGRPLLTLTGHTGQVAKAAFSPDGARLATASEDGTVKVWDAVTGQVLLTLVGHGAGWVNAVTFSADGTRLATASDDRTAKLWDAQTGEELLTFSGHAEWLTDVAISPDGSRLITASADRTARIWDTATGQPLDTYRADGTVFAVAFSPDGARLAAGTTGKTRVWDVATGQELFSLRGRPDTAAETASSGVPSGVATAGSDAVSGVAFSPDCVSAPHALAGQCGTRLATLTWDGTVRVWNLSPSRELLALAIPGSATEWRYHSIALSPDGTRLAAGFMDGSLKLWDISLALQAATSSALGVDTATTQELWAQRGRASQVNAVAFSPDGTRLAVSNSDATAELRDATTGQELLAWRTPDGQARSYRYTPIAFNPEGTRLAITGSNSAIRLWDISTELYSGLAGTANQPLLTLPNRFWTLDLAFSSLDGGARLAAASTRAEAQVWDAATGQELFWLSGQLGQIDAVAFSPDGARLATASADGTAAIWDAFTGRRLRTFLGHAGAVHSVAFSPQDGGARLATGGLDGTVRLWDADTGQQLLTLRGHTAPVVRVAFTPACPSGAAPPGPQCGTRLFTVGADGLVRFYLLKIEDLLALARTRVTRSLTAQECRQYLHRAPEQCP